MDSAVIVAAGKGSRMGGARDKLFLEANGEPIIAHTWRRFDQSPGVDEVVVVIRLGREAAFQKVAEQIRVEKSFRLVGGGAERQDSVWNGLRATSEAARLVAVQDGARPCSSSRIIADCLAAAEHWGASVAAARVADTLKEADGEGMILRNVDRTRLWAVQTPQVFRREILMRALQHAQAVGAHFTDDAAACEWIGQPVALVENNHPNPKVTVEADLPFVEWLLSRK